MAVDRNEDVMEMVEEMLREDPGISNDALRRKAEGIDSGIAELSARQFNARYPLQVKRQLKREQEDAGSKATDGEVSADEAEVRSAAREALLNFARAVAGLRTGRR